MVQGVSAEGCTPCGRGGRRTALNFEPNRFSRNDALYRHVVQLFTRVRSVDGCHRGGLKKQAQHNTLKLHTRSDA